MGKSVDSYFAFGSPASYLARMQWPKICVGSGAGLLALAAGPAARNRLDVVREALNQ